jgi:hypothetical protein
MGAAGLICFFKPTWLAKRGADFKKLREIRICGLMLWGALALTPFLPLLKLHRITATTAWNLFMGGCAIGYGIVGLLWFRTPEKFANRIVSAREIRRFGILMWLLVALCAIAYLL